MILPYNIKKKAKRYSDGYTRITPRNIILLHVILKHRWVVLCHLEHNIPD